MSKVNISHVSNMHSQWLRSLNFYKTEIAIMRGLLTEVAGKNSDSNMLREVEHFENQFRLQGNNIDSISRDIHVNIDAIAKEAANSSAGYVEGSLVETHNKLGEHTAAQENTMKELMHSFRKFAAQWM